MGFKKVGTPTPVSSVTASCKCAACQKECVCTLEDGRYLCEDCLSKSPEESSDTEGQNGVS